MQAQERARLTRRVEELEDEIARERALLEAATRAKEEAEADMARLEEEDRRLTAILATQGKSVLEAYKQAGELRRLADEFEALAARAAALRKARVE